MPATLWLWIFRLAVLADLAAIFFQWYEVRLVSKPLIVLSLLFYFIRRVDRKRSFAPYFTAGMVFSLLGDIALLFESRQEIFFMLGLGCFLLAHILYILAFRKVAAHNKPIPVRWGWIIAVVAYLGILLYILLPYLGELKIPVIVYAVVLCAMLLSVVHAFRSPYTKPGVICVAGALLFVISDSVLAIDKFHTGFPLSGLVIMFTYAFAQYLLATGLVRHSGSNR
jgi:uncharacterized membrane protein YhhN